MEGEQITLDEITVHQARPGDLDRRMEIMAEAAAWLVGKGVHQWPSPPNKHWRRRIAAGIESGLVYLAIRNHLHGQSLGAALLSWAEERIRGQGRLLARLDCSADNRRLRRFYEDKGYAYRGQMTDRDYRAALYEKKLETASENF